MGTGLGLILLIGIMGGIIAFLGDKLGSKIGKKKLTIFGLRPYYTSVLMTVLSGVTIAAVTMGVLSVASQDVRTALFGMEKIRQEIAGLTADREKMGEELTAQTSKVKELHEQIDLTNTEKNAAQAELVVVQGQLQHADARVASAQQQVENAKGQVQELESSRTQLKGEVSELEEATRKLREGLSAIREGEVIFRSGEVLYAGVLQAGLKGDANTAQMTDFLARANAKLQQDLGTDADVQILWLPQEVVTQALSALSAEQGDRYVRVCAAGNIIAGELAVARMEMVANNLVFANDTVLLRQDLNFQPNSDQPEKALMAFLQDVNKTSVAAGIIPDPLTGKVGQITAEEINVILERLRESTGRVTLTAYAKGDIYISGPVRLQIKVQKHAQ